MLYGINVNTSMLSGKIYACKFRSVMLVFSLVIPYKKIRNKVGLI